MFECMSGLAAAVAATAATAVLECVCVGVCVCATVYPCRQEVAPLPQFSLAFCLHSVLYSAAPTHTHTHTHTLTLAHTHTQAPTHPERRRQTLPPDTKAIDFTIRCNE